MKKILNTLSPDFIKIEGPCPGKHMRTSMINRTTVLMGNCETTVPVSHLLTLQNQLQEQHILVPKAKKRIL